MQVNNTLGNAFPHQGEASLSFLESNWLWFYTLHSNPVLVTAAISFLFHEFVYFVGWTPYLIVDFIPYFHQFKLQPGKKTTSDLYWKALKGVLFSHFFIQTPLLLGFHPTAETLGIKITEVPFPTWWKVCAQVLFCAIFEDAYHYWMHRALHWGPLYKNIHKIHHEFSAPFGLTAEYAHPLETFILGLGTIGGPLLLAYLTGDVHMITVLAWIGFRLFQTIEAHSGYEFPISLKTIIPFWSGSDHHDFHHQAFLNCYSTSFRWWDHFLGTDTKYHAFRAKQQEEKLIRNKENKTK
eukprot:TRINITY_DN2051_c0_g1_i1.p1 TRINITY_DN2051_c0_g1~~TRINITY_DN2051_c0_g1_i1.p1  ORF type:complete len:295 (-),score=81.05 TRINITY_DN2051_c0_g1_i1:79-963(-)